MIVEKLHDRFKDKLESGSFRKIMDILIYANPLAIAPQVWMALTATSVEGISAWMWILFLAIQLILAINGILLKSSSQFWSMVISMLESLTIALAVFIRG